MTFRLSPEIELPANAATSTYAFLGTRGSGKTYGAGVLVEELLTASTQVVIVDPVGVWWALRLAADGNGRGFDVPVFGGIHGDVPLEPTAGELVATLVVEQHLSVVLDVSDFTDGQQRRFVEAFSRMLFQLKKRNKSPTHLVFEEAHEFFPQVVDGASAPMVGATKRLWKVGRNYGIGGSLISTRAAEINKNALNISDRVITGKLAAPEDVKRIKDWASSNGVNADQVAALPSLPKGQLIVWRDPSEGGAVVTTFRRKRTFDASRTPEAGDAQPSRGLPAVDLVAIRVAMAATIEAANDNDPKALRAEVNRLRNELATAPGRAEMVGKLAQDAQDLAAERDRLRAALEMFEGATAAEMRRLRAMEQRFDQVMGAVDGYRADGGGKFARADYSDRVPSVAGPSANGRPITNFRPMNKAEAEAFEHAPRVSDFPPSEPRRMAAPRASDGDGSMRMLRALAERHPTPLTKKQLGTLALLKTTGGTFANYLSKLCVSGHVERDGGILRLTDAGLRAAGPVDRPTKPRELLTMWRSRLPAKAGDMLEWLAVEPRARTRAELAEHAQLEVGGGTFANYLSKLTVNGLIERGQGGFRAVSSLVVR